MPNNRLIDHQLPWLVLHRLTRLTGEEQWNNPPPLVAAGRYPAITSEMVRQISIRSQASDAASARAVLHAEDVGNISTRPCTARYQKCCIADLCNEPLSLSLSAPSLPPCLPDMSGTGSSVHRQRGKDEAKCKFRMTPHQC